MHHQPQISTISTAAPPSYSEAINQQPPSKNNFPLPPFHTHTYETHVQPGIEQYPTASNYQGYNASPLPYNHPTYISMERNPPQTCVVTNPVVHRKNRNVACSSCVKILLFSIIIICVSCYLLKVIIATIMN